MAVNKKHPAVSADSVRAGQHVWMHGGWWHVAKVRHVNKHPVQLFELVLTGLDVCLRVPAGWQVRVRKEETATQPRAVEQLHPFNPDSL